MKLNQMDVLRKQGWKIKVTHYRYATRDRINRSGALVVGKDLYLLERRDIDEHNNRQMAHIPYVIQPCGGRVVVVVESPTGFRAEGRSECSVLDNFNRKIGTAMAFGRAMKQFFPRKQAA